MAKLLLPIRDADNFRMRYTYISPDPKETGVYGIYNPVRDFYFDSPAAGALLFYHLQVYCTPLD